MQQSQVDTSQVCGTLLTYHISTDSFHSHLSGERFIFSQVRISKQGVYLRDKMQIH